MIKIIGVFILLIYHNVCYLQSYRVFKDSGKNLAYSVLPVTNGYILLVGNSCDSMCNSIYKVDSNGVVIYKKEYYGFGGQLYKSLNPALEFIICGINIDNGKYRMILKEIDFDGDERKTINISFPNSSIYGNQVIDDGSGYIFNSTKFPANPPIDTAYIFKLDYEGNLIWENKIIFEKNATYLVNNLVNMTQFSSGEYAIVGKYIYYDSQSIFPYEKSFLIRFNSSGLVSYSSSFPEFKKHLRKFKDDSCVLTNMQHFVCAGNDNSYVVSSIIDTVITIPGKDWAYKHALLIKLDENNAPIKYTIIENYLDARLTLNILKCNNEDIVYLDYAGDPIFFPDYQTGFRISRVNSEGVVIWQRTYISPFYNPDSTEIGSFSFVDMAELADGSFIIIGSHDNYIKELNLFDQDAFVMILDSDGCFNDSCQNYTNIFQLAPSVSTQNTTFDKIQTYPNPANEKLSLKLNDMIKKELMIEVYNLIGERVLSLKNYPDIKEYSLDISKLVDGIYFLKIYDGNQFMTSEKFIKQNN